MNGGKKGAAVCSVNVKKRKKESDDREKREQGQAKIKLQLQYVCLILAHENKMETEKRRRKQEQYHKNKEWNYYGLICIQGVRYVYITERDGLVMLTGQSPSRRMFNYRHSKIRRSHVMLSLFSCLPKIGWRWPIAPGQPCLYSGYQSGEKTRALS